MRGSQAMATMLIVTSLLVLVALGLTIAEVRQYGLGKPVAVEAPVGSTEAPGEKPAEVEPAPEQEPAADEEPQQEAAPEP